MSCLARTHSAATHELVWRWIHQDRHRAHFVVVTRQGGEPIRTILSTRCALATAESSAWTSAPVEYNEVLIRGLDATDANTPPRIFGNRNGLRLHLDVTRVSLL